MPKYKMEYGIGHCSDEILIEAENKDSAMDQAYELCREELESYDGLHGYPYYGDCKSCNGDGKIDDDICDECDGEGSFSWEEFEEGVNSWANYKIVEEINE